MGDIDLAEDAVQEAFAVAVGRWPGDGVPPNPGGWITTTARHHAIDRRRRESRGRELLSEVALLAPGGDDPGRPQQVGPVPDDRLRLIFTCCHPALSTQAQLALTLRLLGGLSAKQVARSLLVSEQTMARRLVRAKHKIKAARIPYRVPEAQELPDRLRPVLAVVDLVDNAGLSGPADPGLCVEAIRLARILAALLPDEPEVAGLLALLLLTESRRRSRLRPEARWWCWASRIAPGGIGPCSPRARRPFVAAVAATSPAPISSRRPSTPGTPTPRPSRRPTGRRSSPCTTSCLGSPHPGGGLNRAIAIGELQGPAAALALVDELDLDGYHPFHATRADLLRRLGRHREAAPAYQRAAAIAPTQAERDFLSLGGRASR